MACSSLKNYVNSATLKVFFFYVDLFEVVLKHPRLWIGSFKILTLSFEAFRGEPAGVVSDHCPAA